MAHYIPERGDLIALTFDPQSGHEQRGRRAVLVVSHFDFNKYPGIAIVCPVTTTDRGFPFHVEITECPKVTGFVMVEQVKSIDFRTCRAKRIAKAPPSVLEEALSILDTCIY